MYGRSCAVRGGAIAFGPMGGMAGIKDVAGLLYVGVWQRRQWEDHDETFQCGRNR